ncbi:MAG: M23 family metallopeptidase [Cyclobacteriaceae bacterium]|nr:M23 family metallopeptidase [Cyclobacteriaceae bacterium SS2]
MAKLKYYYNTHTCNYERIRVSKMDVFLNFLGFFLLVLVFAVGIIFTLSRFYDTPKLTNLKKEREVIIQSYQDLHKELNANEDHLASLAEKDDGIYRIYFEQAPIPTSIRKGGVGGTNRRNDIYESTNSDREWMIGTYQKIDQLSHEILIQEKSYNLIDELAYDKAKMYASIPAIQPISIDDMTRLASIFGMRMHPLLQFERKHEGIDFTAPRGTPIHASGNGYVEAAFYSTSGGYMVVINHGYSYQTRYLHMSKFDVVKGQKVKRGDVIGYVGSTGLSRAPHLHYEVLKNGEPVNPVHYFNKNLTQEQYELIVELVAKQNDFD